MKSEEQIKDQLGKLREQYDYYEKVSLRQLKSRGEVSNATENNIEKSWEKIRILEWVLK